MSLDRELVLLALGSPREPDAKAALDIVLESLYEEANTIAGENTKDSRPLALACRLEALKEFVGEYFVVGWSEATPAAMKAEAAE